MSLPYRDRPDWSAEIVVVCAVFVMLVLLAARADRVWNSGRVMTWVDGVQAQQAAPKALVQYQEKRGAQPDVILITRETLDTWQLCAQRPDSNVVDCRSVKEARGWLRERPAVRR